MIAISSSTTNSSNEVQLHLEYNGCANKIQQIHEENCNKRPKFEHWRRAPRIHL